MTNLTQLRGRFLFCCMMLLAFGSVSAWSASPVGWLRDGILAQNPGESRGARRLKFTAFMSADVIQDGVTLGSTFYKASDGVRLTVLYNDFDDAPDAAEFFEKELARAVKIVKQGKKTDANGKVVGERAQILLPGVKPNETIPAVLWTDERKFREIYSTSLPHILALERVYK